jgi:hypothetical protein
VDRESLLEQLDKRSHVVLTDWAIGLQKHRKLKSESMLLIDTITFHKHASRPLLSCRTCQILYELTPPGDRYARQGSAANNLLCEHENKKFSGLSPVVIELFGISVQESTCWPYKYSLAILATTPLATTLLQRFASEGEQENQNTYELFYVQRKLGESKFKCPRKQRESGINFAQQRNVNNIQYSALEKI